MPLHKPYTGNYKHAMVSHNWASYGPSQSPAGVSHQLTPGDIYHYTSAVRPQVAFTIRRNKRIKIFRSYSYAPNVASYRENHEYTKEITSSEESYQICYDNGQEHGNNYERPDNYVAYSRAANLNTSNDGRILYGDPLDFYLTLPKELFPSARNIKIDPNPIIEEFCKLSNFENHVQWILDLEFGMPKVPISRWIPMYNIKYNTINCLNAPDVIHPDFEKCNQNFKRVLIFYYNYIVSTWYKGYIILTRDNSVENFQSWFSLPVQYLGMCWP